MFLIYMDDSKDQVNKKCVYSGIMVHEKYWMHFYKCLKNTRTQLKREYGIYTNKEFHAWKFLSGRGKLSEKFINKQTRCEIFNRYMVYLSRHRIHIINGIAPISKEDWLFERLMNRINKTMESWDEKALVICDQGKENEYTKLTRKMKVINRIPSDRGVWKDTGKASKNIPVEHIIEDPQFKDSKTSYLIQMADFVAFSFLRREVPTEKAKQLGFDQSFNLLNPVLLKEANRKDAEGVVRI